MHPSRRHSPASSMRHFHALMREFHALGQPASGGPAATVHQFKRIPSILDDPMFGHGLCLMIPDNVKMKTPPGGHAPSSPLALRHVLENRITRRSQAGS